MSHIRHTHEERKHTAWCGKPLSSMEWAFQDLDHAAYANLSSSLIRPCRGCVEEAVEALRKAFEGVEVLPKKTVRPDEIAQNAWKLRMCYYDEKGEMVLSREPEPEELAAEWKAHGFVDAA